MVTDQLQFYKAMNDINNGIKSHETISKDHNFTSVDSYEFILVVNAHKYLKKRESSGSLYKNEPSLKTDKFTLQEFINQKIWWHSGPDKYFEMEEEISYLTDLIVKLKEEQELTNEQKKELDNSRTTIISLKNTNNQIVNELTKKNQQIAFIALIFLVYLIK